jgi:hypothetical protein
MSGDETFAARWSRLKRKSAAGKGRAQAQSAEEKAQNEGVAAKEGPRLSEGHAREQRPEHPASEPPFDPAALPPIDSIVAGSDIRAFLQKGVPAELTKAALRRAWTSDPAIRDFIGIAENQWDFTDPAAIPGFGPLEATGDLPQLIAQAMGELPTMPEAANLPGEAPVEIVPTEAAEAGVASETQVCADDAVAEASAPQHPEPARDTGAVAIRKGHGGALPR